MPEIDKKYLYKVSRNGTHLGNLTNVVSNFGYQQTIRTGGSQMTIRVGVTADTADQEVSELLTEDGEPITTEDNQTLTTERVPDAVGDGNEDNLIRNDNTVEVVEFSDYYPNGITVFKGYIAKWKATFGGTDDIEITVISNGQDLTQYLVEAGDTVYISQLTHSSQSHAYTETKGNTYYVGQTFTMPVTKTVDAISVMATTSEAGTLYVTVRRLGGSSPSLPGDTVVASGSVVISGAISQTETKIVFDDAVELATGYTYIFYIGWSQPSICGIRQVNPSAYANGYVWLFYWYGTAYSTPVGYSDYDLYFKIWEYGGNTTATYTLQDPTYMLTDIMDEYRARGGYIQEPTSPVTPLVEQEVQTAALPDSYWSNYYGQTFTPTENMTINLLQLRGKVTSGTGYINAEIYQGNPNGDLLSVTGGMGEWDNAGSATLIGSATNNTFTNTEERDIPFIFTTPITLTAGVEYFISLFFDQGMMANQTLYGAGSGTTPTDTQVGSLYYANVSINNSSDTINADSAYPYLYFKLAYEDPMPDFLSSGYDDTGLQVTYTFQQQTILEAVGVISDFLPYTWYWYVDPADEVLYCKEVSSTPDHYIIKGRHIDELSIEATKERIANVAYFTGGPVAGVNIFVKTTNAESLANNRVGMVKLSDNRVITDANGTLINQNYLDLHSAEEYIAQVVINDSTYDITQFKLGHTIKFQGFGTFMDRLTLQIVGLNRAEERITLDIGILPKRSSEKIEELDRELTLQQTLLNPSVPS